MSKLTVDLVTVKLRETSGNLAAAARALGVTRQAIYGFIKRHPSLTLVLDDSREGMKDNVESVLYKKAIEGESWAVMFFLRTQGRDRGYTESARAVNSLNWDMSRFTDDELERIAKGEDPSAVMASRGSEES